MKVFSVKLLYAYKFLGQCLPIYAFYTILFLQRGITASKVALLIALWSVFSILFEIPSGILADRWNRRNMLALSAVLQGLCFEVWCFSHSFALFAAGFVLWGVSGAFASGTEEGLIYDNLKSDGREDSFGKVYGRAQFFANAGALTGIASAGVLANFIPISTIALLSAAICFVNALVAMLLREKNFYARQLENEPGGFLATFRQAGAFLRRSRLALVCVLFLVFFASLGSYLDEFDALIINDFQLNSLWVSVILTVRFTFVALGSLCAAKLQSKLTSIGQIILLNGLACFLLGIFAMVWNQYAILVFGLSCMAMAAVEVLLVDRLQNEIKEEGRATVMSFYGAGQNVVMVGFSLLYALLLGLFSLQQTYLMLSVYGILGGLGFYLLYKKERAKT